MSRRVSHMRVPAAVSEGDDEETDDPQRSGDHKLSNYQSSDDDEEIIAPPLDPSSGHNSSASLRAEQSPHGSARRKLDARMHAAGGQRQGTGITGLGSFSLTGKLPGHSFRKNDGIDDEKSMEFPIPSAGLPKESTGRLFTHSAPRMASGCAPQDNNDPHLTDDSSPQRGQQMLSSTSSKAIHHHAARIHDDPKVTAAYQAVPMLEMLQLPRGGTSIETKSVGRIQFGIPPETIKDSMRLGLEVPRVYIVPVERFCREMGPALGINLAEFEFPAYFNWFVRRKKCILVVDSEEAERNIRSVFEETLLGPREFRVGDNPKEYEDEDFDPSFPLERRPNFYKEFRHFRISEKNDVFDELTTDMLLDFCHFKEFDDSTGMRSETGSSSQTTVNSSIGVPKVDELLNDSDDEGDMYDQSVMNKQMNASFPTIASKPRWFSKRINFRKNTKTKTKSDDKAPQPTLVPQQETEANDDGSLSAGSIHQDESLNDDDSLGGAPNDAADDMFVSLSVRTMEGEGEKNKPKANKWMYSQVKWLGAVATVWPMTATPQQIQDRSVPRAEIFRMPGAADYVIHDVDENNFIIGKARFNGSVRVPNEIAVEGFLSPEMEGSAQFRSGGSDMFGEHSMPSILFGPQSISPSPPPPPTFYPPSFGITVLGNSHGFDKNGSTSGYVLWINGRGVMVDPPPYSSATLEREGIRPQMIIGVIITHCHADHDAGAFQKVLTGSRLSIITSPSIYNSFIRKYAALSGLRPSLLRHSHRYRPAIIGQPLRFQGATFHFTFSLHTIPCIAFKVEWRGRSVVFTGDHLNHPQLLEELQQTGVLSKGRADDLKNLPLQDCDVLLHEAGAPPIHTPLAVLQELPEHIRKRMYVVHTSALPPGCPLQVAPTGTAGTIRLDQQKTPNDSPALPSTVASGIDVNSLADGDGNKNLTVLGDYAAPSKAALEALQAQSHVPPVVFMRPTDVSDAWFVLNLLSNIPFFATLSYINTMDILEIAQVEVFCEGDVVVPARERSDVLCVVWEGSCVEREKSSEGGSSKDPLKMWYPGDWSGPVSMQPDAGKLRSTQCKARDIVAASAEGVKVIMLQVSDLEKILMRGSKMYRKYLTVQEKLAIEAAAQVVKSMSSINSRTTTGLGGVVDVLKLNSVLRNLSAPLQRNLESIAEGPRVFEEGTPLWRIGDRCDFAFLIIAGTASFGHYQFTHARSRRLMSRSGVGSSSRASISNIVEISDGRSLEADRLLKDVSPESEYARLKVILSIRADRVSDTDKHFQEPLTQREILQENTRDRYANQVLSRLYSSRKYSTDLVFSRGCFLCDTSRMVGGELVDELAESPSRSESQFHSSNMMPGPDGCVAYVFPRSSLVPFLDGSPGVLLSLLGTQVVV